MANNLNNNIAALKRYVQDDNNTYQVFKEASLTTDLETPMTEFVGNDTMFYPVYSFDSSDVPNYDRKNGYVRGNVILERKAMQVTQDKGEQLAIDRLDLLDSEENSIKFYNQFVRQKEVPSIDRYRLSKLSLSGTIVEIEAPTVETILSAYDAAAAALFNKEVPVEGTILYTNSTNYNNLKNSKQITRIAPVTENNGSIDRTVEMIDKVTKIISIPATRWPAGIEFILVQPSVVKCGKKYNQLYVIEEPEDFDGVLINTRYVHDLLVVETQKDGVYVAKTK